MNKRLCKTLPILCVALVVAFLVTVSGVAAAQDVFRVNYFSNANTAGAPDGTVWSTNPGVGYQTLCAMVYVFDWDQQMTECCGCPQTHNDLRWLSVNIDLTGNPLTGRKSKDGVYKIVSAAVNNAPCDPTANVTPTPNLRAWGTHIQNKVGASYPITETAAAASTLGATELANLQAQCAFIAILGSGNGVCSCGIGD
jgi:hypothetical protein